jgi:hypothetical protein
MPLGLGRRPGTQGQSNHATRFKTILRRSQQETASTIHIRREPVTVPRARPTRESRRCFGAAHSRRTHWGIGAGSAAVMLVVTRSHSRFCFSAPVQQPQRCRSGRRAQPSRQAPDPPRSSPRVSEHRRRLLLLSPWAPWESSPERPLCSSSSPGAPDGCCCPLGLRPDHTAPSPRD